jgi:hypothetical protein
MKKSEGIVVQLFLFLLIKMFYRDNIIYEGMNGRDAESVATAKSGKNLQVVPTSSE